MNTHSSGNISLENYQSLPQDGASQYNCQPGLCVIISNTVFDVRGLHSGVRDDHEASLQILFTILGFDVKVHTNLTAYQIKSKVENYSKREHTGVFVLVILSQGAICDGKVEIYGTDSDKVQVEALEKLFFATVCPSLQDKPKIFLIDVYGSSMGSSSSHTISLRRSGDYERLTSGVPAEPIAESKDFAIVYALTNKRSKFTQAFCSAIIQAESTTPFQDIMENLSTRDQTVIEFVDRLELNYCIKCNAELNEYQELYPKLIEAIKVWVPIRDKTIQEIQKIADKLQEHHKKVNISRVAGSVASATGSVVAIVGFALTPVTLGASLGLAVGGIAVAVAGGATTAGASIVDVVIQRSNVNYVENQLKADFDKLEIIKEKVTKLKTMMEKTKKKCPNVSNEAYHIVLGEVFVQGAVRFGNIGIKAAELGVYGSLEIGAAAIRVGAAAARGIAIAGLVLNVLLIPLDLAEIIRSLYSLHKGSETKVIQKLREQVVKLEKQKQDIIKEFPIEM